MEHILLGDKCIEKLITGPYSYQTVLDIGSGEGGHAMLFANAGKQVTTIDLGISKYWAGRVSELDENPNISILNGDYINYTHHSNFDLIWCCHVLEHQRNVGLFLEKIRRDLNPNGILAITVPPMHDMRGNSPDHRLLGGHVSYWNAGLLIYNLVLAGFDCSKIQIKQYDWNISCILHKSDFNPYKSVLSMDFGDINKLNQYFPSCLSEGSNGNIEEWNW